MTTEGKTETQVTIKGLKEGTTTVTIDGVVYTIEVKAAELENVVLPINLWITNTGVVPDGWGMVTLRSLRIAILRATGAVYILLKHRTPR